MFMNLSPSALAKLQSLYNKLKNFSDLVNYTFLKVYISL